MPRLDPKLSNLFGYVEPIECFTMSRPVSVALNGSAAETRGVSSTGSRRGRTDWAAGSCTSRWTTWRPWRARSSSWTGRKGFEAFLLKVSAWREPFISIQSLLLIRRWRTTCWCTTSWTSPRSRCCTSTVRCETRIIKLGHVRQGSHCGYQWAQLNVFMLII